MTQNDTQTAEVIQAIAAALHARQLPEESLIGEFIARCAKIERAANWNEAFGRLDSRRVRCEAVKQKVHAEAIRLAVSRPNLPITRRHFFRLVGDKVSLSGTACEKHYYVAIQDGKQSVHIARILSKSNQSEDGKSSEKDTTMGHLP